MTFIISPRGSGRAASGSPFISAHEWAKEIIDYTRKYPTTPDGIDFVATRAAAHYFDGMMRAPLARTSEGTIYQADGFEYTCDADIERLANIVRASGSKVYLHYVCPKRGKVYMTGRDAIEQDKMNAIAKMLDTPVQLGITPRGYGFR